MEFVLFSEDTLSKYLNDRYITMLNEPKHLSNDAVIEMYPQKDSYIERTVKKHQVEKVQVKSTKEEGVETEPFSRPLPNSLQNATRTFIKYKFPLNGNESLLRLNPETGRMPSFRIPAITYPQPKMLAFSIDTGYHNSFTLPTDIQQKVNSQAIQMKDYIMHNINDINAKIDAYNSGLAQEMTKVYEQRYNEALAFNKAKGDSNPF